MDKEKLLKEHSELVESLIEKTKYIYSEKFYELDEFEKQKFIKDKMATEGHLNSLSSLLWNKTYQICAMTDWLMYGLLGSMFGSGSGFGSSSTYQMPTTQPIQDTVIEKD